eukprot:TRINITY_DN336_c0_g1_i4.p2 TRINITY_DN336_c0_g1~~TRINITY_DN336_c0_g1_i4.p2  ORF type:complete len:163 (-),score=38.32 TRINITY_DN336_c0_g1_i4:10-498(-)
MVLISKQQKRLVYSYLFEEGVIVVKKDTHLKKHQHVDVPNLNVMCIMKTLVSKKFVSEMFCWNWYYFAITKEGVKFLSQYLGISENVLPKTFKSQPKKPGEEDERREERRGYGQRRGRGRGTRARGARTEEHEQKAETPVEQAPVAPEAKAQFYLSNKTEVN